GRLEIAGLDAHRERRRLRHYLGYTGHALGLYPALSAAENLEFFCELQATPRSRIDEVLEAVGLAATAKRRAAQLSRGMQQRLAIVLALLIANFGFQLASHTAPSIAPGILCLALVFAGLVAFGRTFAAERDQASLEAMLQTPASPVAIFAGKAIAASLLLIVCEAVMLPALSLFFDTPLGADMVAAVLLATGGMA